MPAGTGRINGVALRLQVTALDDPQARVFRYDFDADRAQILLGRRGGVDVLLPHAKVSLVHACIERRGADYFLVDDGSTNGTRLNGSALSSGERVQLQDGDRISIGNFTLQAALTAAEGEARTESAGTVARRMVREVLERLGPGHSQPSLLVLDGAGAGQTLTLSDAGRTYLLGQGEAGDLRLDDVDMWREHAALVRDEHGVTVRDLGATSELTVNGEPAGGARLLRDGDVLTLSTTRLQFTDPAEVYLRKLERAGAPDELVVTARTQVPPVSVVAERPELALAFLGVVAALAAAAGLAYVLLW
jgi:pSer/pThr/pTyr-binding forkhead associated (FHA) protein